MATERTGTPKAFPWRIRRILHGNRPKLSHPKTGTPKAFLGKIRRILHGNRAKGNVAGLRSLGESGGFSMGTDRNSPTPKRERRRTPFLARNLRFLGATGTPSAFLGSSLRELRARGTSQDSRSLRGAVSLLLGRGSVVGFALQSGLSVSLYKVDSVAFASGGAPQYGNGLRIASEQPRLEVELQLIDMERPTRPIRITYSEFFSQD